MIRQTHLDELFLKQSREASSSEEGEEERAEGGLEHPIGEQARKTLENFNFQ